MLRSCLSLLVVGLLANFSVPAAAQEYVYFFDELGEPTWEYLEGTTAVVVVDDYLANTDPGVAETVSAQLSTWVAGDLEDVALLETGRDTGRFLVSIDMVVGPASAQNGVIETLTDPGPPFQRDTLQAEYGLFSSNIIALAGSITRFVDADGLPQGGAPIGGPAYLEVTDPEANDPLALDTVTATVTVWANGDTEVIQLAETGLDTGIFEGSVLIGPSIDPDDGILNAAYGNIFEAVHQHVISPDGSSDQAAVTGSNIWFIDAPGGAPVEEVLEGDTAHVRVVDYDANADPLAVDTTTVDFFVSWTTDQESLSVTETGVDTSTFEGSIPTGTSPFLSGNGALETTQDPGPPVQFDLIFADHTDAYGFSSAGADTVGGRVWFLDALGAEVSTYELGSTVYIRAEDHEAPGGYYVVEVSSSLGGDVEYVSLLETGVGTSVFEGTVDLQIGPAFQNGVLQAWAGDEIQVSFQDFYGYSTPTDYAAVGLPRIDFEDSAGAPTVELLENDLARVRLTNAADNVDPLAIDTVSVALGSLYAADTESLLLYENEPSSGVFYGEIVTAFIDPSSGSGTPGDGVLETTNSDVPDFLGDQVTVSHAGLSAAATMIGPRLVFIDEYGLDAETYIQGSHVWVRMIQYGYNDPGVVDVDNVQVSALTGGDVEQVYVMETGPDTNVFEGWIHLGQGTSQGDGVLTAADGEQIEARGYAPTGTVSVDLATITPNGQPSVSITAPADGAGFTADDIITFSGTADDPEDGDLTAGISWNSNLDGDLGYGGSVLAALSVGSHIINAVVWDSIGASANDTITVTIDGHPSVSITAPADGAGFNQGDSITFSATASDAEDGDLTASLAWTSQIDGAIGSGGSFSTSGLSPVTHAITATVTDSGGLQSSDMIFVTVNAGPSVSITAPADGAGFNLGDSISFSAAASDPEDGNLTASLAWTSDVDGAIGSGGSFSTSSLSAGAHVITASVTDSGGFAGSDAISITVNAGPSVTITTPADGSGFNAADSISFAGTANDAEDGDLSASLAWTSDVDGAIGSGGSFSTSSLSAGAHVITASVTDAGGLQASDAINITVNAAPSVTITAPADGSDFNTGDSISFTGTANDTEDGDLTASLAWTSDVDGAIGSGGSFATSSLSVGTHVITASVTDAGGLEGSDVITITVNSGPSVTITAPADGAGFNTGDSIAFTGTANDPEDGDLTAGLAWTSDVDGAIGSGGSFSTSSLSAGTHVITASVTDAGGLEGSDAITITVNAGPSVTITAPADGSGFNAGDSITFTGTASDPEDGDLTASLSWTSDVDGAIGSGGSFSTSSLSSGTHVITASATDAGGLEGSDAITITVNAGPSVTITAPADGAGFNVGDSITFTGTASDPEEGDLTAAIAWTSSLEGTLGGGGSFSTSSLSAGTHLITAEVIDGGGLQATDAVTITVNAAPTVSITAPADGSSFNVGANVGFAGTANDLEDGNLTANLAWTSSLDGAIGSGGSFSTSGLSTGTHLITASVTDSGGLQDSDAITVTVNAAPAVSITAPADGAGFNVGASVGFTGTASDAEDGDLSATLAWSSSLDGAIGSGGSFSTSGLSAGTHVITASVTDSGGLQDSDAITLTVNAGPSVSIAVPADGASFNVGASVSFTGTASDTEDGDLTASLAWTSSVDGAIGSGGSFSTSALSAGTHVITASVTDSGGLEGSDAVTITVNAGPSVTITAPADGTGFNVGASVGFTGAANDAEDGDLSAGLAWISSLDGAIGSGGSFSTSTLSAGTHVITASVTDSWGLQGSDAVTLTVNAGPAVLITAPADGSTFVQGDPVGFTGSASDPEDGDLTAAITWTSSLDGVIGSGGSFSTSALSVGVHTITASVTDSGGLSAVDVVTLTVQPPPVQVVLTSIAAEDGWLRESSEGSNVGGRKNTTTTSSSALRPGDDRKDKQYKSVVSFDTSQIPAGATILSATVRLQRGTVKGTNPFTTHGTCWVDVESGGFSGSTALEKGDFEAAATAVQAASLSNAAANGDWSEGSLDAAGLAAIDVTGTTQMRVYFDLDDNDDRGDDYVGYYSGDNSTSSRHPQLVVVYQP